MQVLWRLFMLGSRILALTLFLTSFDYIIVAVLLVHWLVMFIWILTMKTNFCENNVEEVFYDALVAIMFIFAFFNPIDNDTRLRYTIFFTVMLLENSCLLYFWYRDCTVHFNLPCNFQVELISSYYIFFSIGIIIMVLYYLYFHPLRNIKFFRTEEDLKINKRRHSYVSRDTQRRIFSEVDWATEEQIEQIKKHLIDQLSHEEALIVDSKDIEHIGKIKKVLKRRKRIVNSE